MPPVALDAAHHNVSREEHAEPLKQATPTTGSNQRPKLIIDLATGQVEDKNPDEGKNPAAVELGRLGGKNDGKARAVRMTAEERRRAAQNAACARRDEGL